MKDFIEMQRAITLTKKLFTEHLETMGLMEVCAPMLVRQGDGVQDGLSGIENAVKTYVRALQENFEVVHSLAKWKRQILRLGNFQPGRGFYSHMKALRPDEVSLDAIHSVFVDQWDWEKVINKQNRSLSFLKETVRTLYSKIVAVHRTIGERYQLENFLPEEIKFMHSQQLLDEFPHLCSKAREDAVCKKYGAIFIIGIGAELTDGTTHGDRAPDYDDWSTVNSDGFHGLNGDILVWNPILSSSFELSSMGIRVDKAALERQLAIKQNTSALDSAWHQSVIRGKLPLSIGGGIGVSRMVMLMLQQSHIGKVQFGSWAKSEIAKYGLLDSFNYEKNKNLSDDVAEVKNSDAEDEKKFQGDQLLHNGFALRPL